MHAGDFQCRLLLLIQHRSSEHLGASKHLKAPHRQIKSQAESCVCARPWPTPLCQYNPGHMYNSVVYVRLCCVCMTLLCMYDPVVYV